MSLASNTSGYTGYFRSIIHDVIRMKVLATCVLRLSETYIRSPNKETRKELKSAQLSLSKLVTGAEDSVVSVIALYSPVGQDLRFIVSVLKISYDIQSFAFWVKRGVSCVSRVSDALSDEVRSGLIQMVQTSIIMINKSFRMILITDFNNLQIKKFREKSEEITKSNEDNENIYSNIFQNFTHAKEAQSNLLKQTTAEEMSIYYDILQSAKSFEKVSNMITDIALIANYILTGSRNIYDQED